MYKGEGFRKFAILLLILLTALAYAGTAMGRSDVDLEDQPALSVESPTGNPAMDEEPPHPMAIQSLRDRSYPGGDFTIIEELPDAENFTQSVVSYQSEGLTIRGLLTIPKESPPDGGFPAVVFVHGYIPPRQYSTTRNYATYQARLARSGFITFKPDLRGHGESEGTPVSAHYSEKYVVDTMFAISYLKNHAMVNPERIGYWGHSNGGQIGLRVVVVSQDIKAASFWAGVVGSYRDMFETYNHQIHFLRGAGSGQLVRTNGLPSTNQEFWKSLDPHYHLEDIQSPIQILHGTADTSVPIVLSRRLKEELDKMSLIVDYHEYEGDDHNLSGNVEDAFRRSIDFYRSYL